MEGICNGEGASNQPGQASETPTPKTVSSVAPTSNDSVSITNDHDAMSGSNPTTLNESSPMTNPSNNPASSPQTVKRVRAKACNLERDTKSKKPKSDSSRQSSQIWDQFTKMENEIYQSCEEEGRTVLGVKNPIFSDEEARRLLAQMIIEDEIPLKFVEAAGFRRLIAYLEPRFVVPSKRTVFSDCMLRYNEEKLKLKMMLRSKRVCLTTDCWTDVKNLGYMCLTAHWIDSQFKLHRRIINFTQIPNRKGETLGRIIENCLVEWGLDKILTLTVDNTSSNDVCLSYLVKRLEEWGDNILENRYMHVRCFAHILNLIVKEGLKEMDDNIVKIRNAIRYVMSSPARLYSFLDSVDKAELKYESRLCLDTETRWDSTFLMLETAIKYEKAFEIMFEDDARFQLYFFDEEEGEFMFRDKQRGSGLSLGAPNENDWKATKVFVKFLAMFYNATIKLSGSLYATSDTFFHEVITIQSKLKQFCQSKNVPLSNMALRMRSKFDGYWDNYNKINLLLYVAIVFDPRYKVRYIKFCFELVYGAEKTGELVHEIVALLKRLFHSYAVKFSPPSYLHNASGSSAAFAREVSNNNVGGDDDVEIITTNDLRSRFLKQLSEEASLDDKNELDKYLLEPCVADLEGFDLLQWWKTNTSEFPVLSHIARDILAIPFSTVASELAFLTNGRILDNYRSTLAPRTLEALVCSHSWLRNDLESLDIKTVIEDMQTFEKIASA